VLREERGSSQHKLQGLGVNPPKRQGSDRLAQRHNVTFHPVAAPKSGAAPSEKQPQRSPRKALANRPRPRLGACQVLCGDSPPSPFPLWMIPIPNCHRCQT
jgi:hypothetical protein